MGTFYPKMSFFPYFIVKDKTYFGGQRNASIQGRQIRVPVPGPPPKCFMGEKSPVRIISLFFLQENHMDQGGRKNCKNVLRPVPVNGFLG